MALSVSSISLVILILICVSCKTSLSWFITEILARIIPLKSLIIFHFHALDTLYDLSWYTNNKFEWFIRCTTHMVVETHVLFLFVFCILESCKISRSISKISTLTSYNIKTFRQSYWIGRMTYFGRLRCVYYTSYFRICYISKYEKRNQLTWKHSYQCFNLFQCIHFYRTLFSIMTPFGIIYFLSA